MNKYDDVRKKAIALRSAGKTYNQIAQALAMPKSTLCHWLRSIALDASALNRRSRHVRERLLYAQIRSRESRMRRGTERIASMKMRLAPFAGMLDDPMISKIVLAILYLGEGGKHRRALMFGNSDVHIIQLFMRLLRQAYSVDEKKIRCTVQCRADQNIKALEKYWGQMTGIPKSQFYKAQVDPRTNGKKSKKPGYMGVCRIDYPSVDLYDEICLIPEIMMGR